MKIGPTIGAVPGLGTLSVSGLPGGYTGAKDATSGWAVPANSSDWTSLLSGSAISNPSLLWLCQEASGNLADSIGAFTGTAGGAPVYRAAVTGWTRKGLTLGTSAGATSAIITNASASLPDISTTSFMALCIVEYPSANSSVAATSLVTMGPTFGSQVAIDTRPSTTPAKLALDLDGGSLNGGRSTNGTNTYGTGTTVGIAILQVNRTAGTVVCQTDLETLSTSTLTGITGKAFILGGNNSSTFFGAGLSVLYAAAWTSTAAELSSTKRATLMSLVRNGH